MSSLGRGLSVDAGDRHWSIGEWGEDLRQGLEGFAASSEGSRDPEVSRSREQQPGRPSPHLVVAGVALAAAVGFGGFIAGRNVQDDSPGVSPAEAPSVGEAVALVAPTPQVVDTYLRRRNDGRLILIVAWGQDPPPEVVGTEVEIAVDGGAWLVEIVSPEPVAKAWEFWSTGPLSNRQQIREDVDYEVRVRWVYTDGRLSPWSEAAASSRVESE